MLYFDLNQNTPDHIIICGAEYAELAGAKPLATLKVEEDGVYSLSRRTEETKHGEYNLAITHYEFAWATTDVAELVMCEYSDKLLEVLKHEKETSPFLYWCDTIVQDWEKKGEQFGVSYDGN